MTYSLQEDPRLIIVIIMLQSSSLLELCVVGACLVKLLSTLLLLLLCSPFTLTPFEIHVHAPVSSVLVLRYKTPILVLR